MRESVPKISHAKKPNSMATFDQVVGAGGKRKVKLKFFQKLIYHPSTRVSFKNFSWNMFLPNGQKTNLNFLLVVLQLEKVRKLSTVHPKKSGQVKASKLELKNLRNNSHK